MNVARFVNVGDSLVAGLNGFFADKTPTAKAERRYAVTVKDLDITSYAAESINFRAFVMPDLPKWAVMTRGKNWWDWPFIVLFYEKCLDQVAIPTNEWVDRRVALVEETMREFADERKALTGDLGALRFQEGQYGVFVDQDELREEQAFWTEVTLTYREAARV